jgi:glycosyltransferase involved in cell wall biosynthesis
MASGLPVVAYDLPAYRKIYSDSYIAVDCFDQGKFADALIDILNNPSSYSALTAKGRSTAAKYDWDTIAEDDLNYI